MLDCMPVKKIDETCSGFECLSKEVFFGLDMVFLNAKLLGSNLIWVKKQNWVKTLFLKFTSFWLLTEPTALESWAWNSHGQIHRDKFNLMIMLKLSLPFQNLTSLEDYDVLVDQVPMWERKLSSLLGDMNIKYDEDSPSVSVVEYLNYLYRVVSLLKKGLLGADASTTIQPGEFKECTARILRFVSFCVIR